MTRVKKRVMLAGDVRTGDVIVPPSATRESVVSNVRTRQNETRFDYSRGAHAELHPKTPVIVRRSSRQVNHDDPKLAYRSE